MISLVRSILSAQKYVNQPALNLAGLQVARIYAARSVRGLRRLAGDSNAEGNHLAKYGYVAIENFLSPSDFAEVEREAQHCLAKVSPGPTDAAGIQDTHAHIRFGTSARDDALPPNEAPVSCQTVFNSPQILQAIAAADGRSVDSLRRSSSIRGRFERTEKVAEPVGEYLGINSVSGWHSDTYHSIYKGFFYITDVTSETAPFTYVPGSNRLKAEHLALHYKTSINKDSKSPYAGADQSRELKGIAKEMVFPKNTLLLADTFGMHRRGLFKETGQQRIIVHIDVRPSPFRM
jgi:hypothetical protein